MSDDEAEICLACNKPIDDADGLITCKECKYPYHLVGCSGLPESSGKTRSASARKPFTCPTCKVAFSRTGSMSEARETFNVAAAFVELTKKLDSLLPVREQVNNIELSMQTMSDHFDEIMQRLDRQDKEITQLRRRVEKIETARPNEQLQQLNADLDVLEFRSRKKNLEIHGVVFTEKEDLLSKINEVAHLLDVDEVSDCDVEACHRLPSKPNKVPGIIIRFERQAVRDRWLRKKSALKESGKNIYICENLSRRTKELLFTTKEWAQTNDWKFAWHANGKVLLRKKEGDNPRVVKDVTDLSKLAS